MCQQPSAFVKLTAEVRDETVANRAAGRGAAMIKLTFKQTDSEMIVRAAASVLFGTLARRGAKLVSISDLAERPQYGFTASAAIEPIGPKFVRITDLQDGKIDWDIVPFCECAEPEKYLLQDDDLLFARTGATTGKTHLVKDAERAVFASYLIRLRPKPGVFAGYLHAFFQSDAYWTQISDEKEGSAQPNVNGEKLAALQIPRVELKLQHAIADFLRCVRRRQDGEKVELPELPAPLAEQRRVVARIEELAAQIHEARTLRYQAAEEAEALGKAGGNASFIEAKNSFGSKRLEELTTRITKGESPEWQGFNYQDTGPYFIRSQNVLWGSLDPHDAVCIPEAFHAKLSRSQLRTDDVLINLVGASIGRTCCVPAGLGDANVNQAVGVISLKREYLLPIFLVHFLLSPLAQDEIHGGKVDTARPNISLGDIRDLEIPTPPLAEQRRIVAELDALQAEVDALKRLQAETAAELAALLPAILDRAFKGEL